MKSVLSTKHLTPDQQALLEAAGLSGESYNALKISYLQVVVPGVVENAIVTSQHTVQALINNQIQIKHCFSVGRKTAAMLRDHGYRVVETTDYGKELAQLLVDRYPQRHFTFFCGSLRLDTIPDVLQSQGVSWEEIKMYEVNLVPKKIGRTFDGIMFFSPSGVESYMLENTIGTVVAFCIGDTTAEAVKPYTHRIVVAHPPTVEDVILQVIEYFKNNP